MANLQGRPSRSLQGMYRSLQGWNSAEELPPARFSNIAVGGGNIYVVERNRNRVIKFDMDGVYVSHWGSYGTGNGQFDFYSVSSSPYNYINYHDGEIFVLDKTRLQVFNTSGVFQRSMTARGKDYYIANNLIYWTVSTAGLSITIPTNNVSTLSDAGGVTISQRPPSPTNITAIFLYVDSSSIFAGNGGYIIYPVSGGERPDSDWLYGTPYFGVTLWRVRVFGSYIFLMRQTSNNMIRNDFKVYEFLNMNEIVKTPVGGGPYDFCVESGKVYTVNGNKVIVYDLDLEYDSDWSYDY